MSLIDRKFIETTIHATDKTVAQLRTLLLTADPEQAALIRDMLAVAHRMADGMHEIQLGNTRARDDAPRAQMALL